MSFFVHLLKRDPVPGVSIQMPGDFLRTAAFDRYASLILLPYASRPRAAIGRYNHPAKRRGDIAPLADELDHLAHDLAAGETGSRDLENTEVTQSAVNLSARLVSHYAECIP